MKRPSGVYAGLLKELVPVADNLTIAQGGVVKATSLHEVPVNEFRIPQRAELIQSAIGACGNKLAWQGFNDVHHISWPYTAYRKLSTDDFESVGESYRNLGALKVKVPRQMHDYFHVGFAQPPIPAEDVMVQFVFEDMQFRVLLRTLLPDIDERIGKFIDPARELARYAQYLDQLATMTAGAVGHFPDTEVLAALPMEKVKTELQAKVGVLRYVNGA